VIPLLSVLHNNLYKKSVLLYAKDEVLQTKIESFNWGGRINTTDRDYLNITSVNLSGTKTDRSIEKDIDLVSEIAGNGSVVNTLTYTIKNPLPAQDGLHNTSFVRFFVPKGSKLLSSKGFSSVTLPSLDNEKYTHDFAVENWERDLSQDQLSGMYIGTEAGKTIYGNWINVKGTESQTITLKYQLPFSIKKLDRYSLLFQKQPGSLPMKFQYTINLGDRAILWKNSIEGVEENKSMKYLGKLETDTFFGLVTGK
ncbi:MAG: hypothetical protein M3Q64_03345, partial [bacterium]|nr:hypothetical protein [bacterium]